MVTDTTSRAQQHAKLMRYADRQTLAFLNRTDGGLSIIVQLWCISQDHQLRVSISIEGADDQVIADAFADLNDESLAMALDELGVAAKLAELEA